MQTRQQSSKRKRTADQSPAPPSQFKFRIIGKQKRQESEMANVEAADQVQFLPTSKNLGCLDTNHDSTIPVARSKNQSEMPRLSMITLDNKSSSPSKNLNPATSGETGFVSQVSETPMDTLSVLEPNNANDPVLTVIKKSTAGQVSETLTANCHRRKENLHAKTVSFLQDISKKDEDLLSLVRENMKTPSTSAIFEGVLYIFSVNENLNKKNARLNESIKEANEKTRSMIEKMAVADKAYAQLQREVEEKMRLADEAYAQLQREVEEKMRLADEAYAQLEREIKLARNENDLLEQSMELEKEKSNTFRKKIMHLEEKAKKTSTISK